MASSICCEARNSCVCLRNSAVMSSAINAACSRRKFKAATDKVNSRLKPVQSASIGLADGTAVLIASVSPPHEPMKGIHLRVMGGHVAWHLHAGETGLLEGKRAFTKERMGTAFDRVIAAKVA